MKTLINKHLTLIELPQLKFGTPKLTIGNKYIVKDVDGSNVIILDDENESCSIGSCRFDLKNI